MEKTDYESELFEMDIREIAKQIRESRGLDRGKIDYFHQNSSPIEIDVAETLILT